MLDKPASTLRIRERLLESERLMEETGCYDGITELELRNQDPLKFETLHTKLRAYCVSAREMARRIFLLALFGMAAFEHEHVVG